jgi:hypothetical protein
LIAGQLPVPGIIIQQERQKGKDFLQVTSWPFDEISSLKNEGGWGTPIRRIAQLISRGKSW